MQVCHQGASTLLALSGCIKSVVGFIKSHQACCWLYQVASSLLLALSSCIKPVVGFIKLHQVCCWLYQVASSLLLALSSCIKPVVGAIKLHQACWLHQVASSLWKSVFMQLDIYRLAASCMPTLYLQTCCQKQLASTF